MTSTRGACTCTRSAERAQLAGPGGNEVTIKPRMLNSALLPCMLLAAVGFIASVAAHIASVADVQLPGGSAVFVLHAGIFVVWAPTVLVMSRFRGRVNNKDIWKVALSGCPAWMRTAVQIIFGYGFLSFFWFLAGTAGHPKGVGPSPQSEVRGFSGHWMIFYSAAFATLYSVRRRPELLIERRCSSQHVVSATAEYCETCGERLT
jgi:hypothetical protein